MVTSVTRQAAAHYETRKYFVLGIAFRATCATTYACQRTQVLQQASHRTFTSHADKHHVLHTTLRIARADLPQVKQS